MASTRPSSTKNLSDDTKEEPPRKRRVETMSNEELLFRIGQSTEETEFYTPMPEGYRRGHHKYVVVVGTVMSGLGKGIFSSSLAKLM